MNPNITIITPSYNAQNCISETIKSVIGQTYKNWELLIIDDCSSDDTQLIIKSFTNIDKRIKLFQTNQPSGSPSLPRNIGIENAKGRYIAFLDADDVWLPYKLELQVKQMEDNDWDISYSYYEKMSWLGVRNDRLVKTRIQTSYKNLLMSNSIPCLTSMVSRDAIGDIRFKQIPQEDFCFWLDILKKGYKAHNICQVTALYREAKSSRSANKIEMFKGYWNVIRKHQQIELISCCYYMMTYSVLGILKYIK